MWQRQAAWLLLFNSSYTLSFVFLNKIMLKRVITFNIECMPEIEMFSIVIVNRLQQITKKKLQSFISNYKGRKEISFLLILWALLDNEERWILSFLDDPNAHWVLLIQAQDFIGEKRRNTRILSCGFCVFLLFLFFFSTLLDFGVLCSSSVVSSSPLRSPLFLLSSFEEDYL